MKQWVENNYKASIKSLAKDNDLVYGRLLNIKKQIDRKEDKIAFINSKIQKYTVKEEVVENEIKIEEGVNGTEEVAEVAEVAEALMQLLEEKVVEEVIEEPRYVMELSLEEKVASLDEQVTSLTQIVYDLRAKTEKALDDSKFTKVLLLISIIRLWIEISEYLF